MSNKRATIKLRLTDRHALAHTESGATPVRRKRVATRLYEAAPPDDVRVRQALLVAADSDRTIQVINEGRTSRGTAGFRGFIASREMRA